jgi:endonuclease/exonuclease/phosphatase family metal-dependent hydrolase
VYVALVLALRVLTWNLMHGRSQPSSGRDLLAEFQTALEGWEWDVALLQEVPPWWPARLAAALDTEYRLVLTSRNSAPALRRAIAVRWPDLIKANGGGSNAILARRDRIVTGRSGQLCRRPERRWVHAVRLACGIWVANLHATAGDDAAARRDGQRAAVQALEWASPEPLVLGGDFNLREPAWPGLVHAGGDDLDHLFVTPGLEVAGAAQALDRGPLSDHAPLAVTVQRPEP